MKRDPFKSVVRFLISAFFVFVGSNAEGAKAWTFDAFMRDLQSGRAQTIEEALLLLPKSVRSSFTLAYEGHGLRGTSFERPGVILFSNDGEFALTFGDEKHARGNELEIARFVAKKAQFDLFKVVFPPKNVPGNPRLERNPRECVQCHRPDPMYLFGDYVYSAGQSKQYWPGLYGSADDVVRSPNYGDANSHEFAPFTSFIGQIQGLERYRTLIRPKGARVHPDDDDSPMSPFTATPKDPRLELRPNDRFTEIVARQNGRRTAGMLLSSPNFREYRYWLLYRMIGCGVNDGGNRKPTDKELQALAARMIESIRTDRRLSAEIKARLMKTPLSVESVLAINGVHFKDLQPNILRPVKPGEYPVYYDGITYKNYNALDVNSVSYFAQDGVLRYVLKRYPNAVLRRAYKPLTAIEQDDYFKDYPVSLAFDRGMDDLAVSIDWKIAKERRMCDELLRLSLDPEAAIRGAALPGDALDSRRKVTRKSTADLALGRRRADSRRPF